MDESPLLGSISSNPSTSELSALAATLKSALFTPEVKSIHRALGGNAALYLVGGALRDALLGRPIGDIDLSSRLAPEVSKKLLEDAGYRVVDTGITHGTVTIVINEEHLELTTFRSPGNRNTLAFSDTIEQDLLGRDFTINALALSLDDFRLVDPYGGISDLKAGLVRATGDAHERFAEDPLRLMRAVRFGSASGRTLETDTKKAASSLASRISFVSPERIRDEFVHILLSPFPAEGVKELEELGILARIVPEVQASVGCEQNEHHIHDVFQHTLWVLDRTPRSALVRLSAFFHDLGKPESLSVSEEGRRHFYRHELLSEKICRDVMTRLRFSKDMIRETSLLVKHHMRPLDCGPSGARRLIRDLGDLLDPWIELKIADSPPRMSESEFQSRLQSFRALISAEMKRKAQASFEVIAVNGHDLMQIGAKSGPALGKVLETLREMVIEDPEINQKNILLAKARELLKVGS